MPRTFDVVDFLERNGKTFFAYVDEHDQDDACNNEYLSKLRTTPDPAAKWLWGDRWPALLFGELHWDLEPKEVWLQRSTKKKWGMLHLMKLWTGKKVQKWDEELDKMEEMRNR
jgi:hypothetical protein